MVKADGQKKLHKGNTAIKFILDQTFGAAVNTILFIAVIGAFKGNDRRAIVRSCRRVCLCKWVDTKDNNVLTADRISGQLSSLE